MAEDDQESPRKRLRLDETGSAAAVVQPAATVSAKHQHGLAITTATDNDLQKELRSGITAFVSPDVPGFSGVFKQRYSDFLVNEILLSNEVLHLVDVEDGKHKKSKKLALAKDTVAGREAGDQPSTSKAADKVVEQSAVAPTSEPGDENSNVPARTSDKTEDAAKKIEIPPIAEEDINLLQTLFGEPATKEIIKLYHSVMRHPDRKRRDFDKIISPEIDDRDVRTKAHMSVRRIFASRLDTTTLQDSSIAISAAVPSANISKNQEWKSRRKAGADASTGRLGWDDLGGQYLHFTLYKENKDTMEVMSFFASSMKLHPRNFTFAGTKDRRGVTVQRISAYRVQAPRLAGLGGQLRNAKIGGFKYEQSPLSLGDLNGNEFVIVLRDAQFDLDEGTSIEEKISQASTIVQTAASSLRTNGFLNYYGLQRFGTFSTSTDQVGTKILQNDFKGAVELILAYTPEVLAAANGDRPDLSIPSDDRKRAVALETWNASKNAHQVLPLLPRKFSGESNIIKHLGHMRHGKRTQEHDYEGALNTLQRPLRLMYVHSYQSLVWNTAAGYRWKKHGKQVIEGDLVVTQTTQTPAHNVDESGEVIIEPQQEDRAVVEDDYVRARALSKEEAESGQYSIWDVVLPLPGFDVVYPANDVGKFYEDFMSSERGGGLNPHDMRRRTKDFSLSGGYRKLLAKPALLECEIKTYTSDTEPLAQTDLDRLLRSDDAQTATQIQPVVEQESSETKLAVVLKLQLGSSQYATMALREMLKAGGLKTYRAAF